MSKNYSGTYLYGKYPAYEKALFTFIMESEEIKKDTDEFDELVFDIKRRQTSTAMAKILKSDKIRLVRANKPLPRQFKVFCAKDIKHGSKENVVFIDCTGLLVDAKSGKMVCRDIDTFISYLQSACHTYIYFRDENRLVNNSQVISTGAKCFADLMTYVVDYVAHISSTPKNKAYCRYMCAQYYIYCILGKDINNSNMGIARKISGLSDREANVIEMQYDVNTFLNIKYFADALSNVLKLNKLTVDVIVERWLYLFGTSTAFAMEMFPAFATMITDAYIGAYMNNQKTIEKVLGPSMVEFAKTIIKIGDEAV